MTHYESLAKLAERLTIIYGVLSSLEEKIDNSAWDSKELDSNIEIFKKREQELQSERKLIERKLYQSNGGKDEATSG